METKMCIQTIGNGYRALTKESIERRIDVFSDL